MDRRSFFRNLGVLAGGVIVAPTLAETLAVSAKKYFFLHGNLSEPIWKTYEFTERFNFGPGNLVRIINIQPPSGY